VLFTPLAALTPLVSMGGGYGMIKAQLKRWGAPQLAQRAAGNSPNLSPIYRKGSARFITHRGPLRYLFKGLYKVSF
jgi:hypothetical protein